MPISRIRFAVIILALGVGWVGVSSYFRSNSIDPNTMTPDAPVRQSGIATIGGPFSLTDHRGVRLTQEALTGRLTLIYFGYTSCPDICPTELQTIGAALDLLAAEGPEKIVDIQGFLISVDPERDTVAVLADYMANFHPKLTGLTGSAEEIAAVAKAYRVYFNKAPSEPGSNTYLMDHSNIIYLMGRDGKFLAHFGFGVTAEQIAAKLREFQR